MVAGQRAWPRSRGSDIPNTRGQNSLIQMSRLAIPMAATRRSYCQSVSVVSQESGRCADFGLQVTESAAVVGFGHRSGPSGSSESSLSRLSYCFGWV